MVEKGVTPVESVLLVVHGETVGPAQKHIPEHLRHKRLFYELFHEARSRCKKAGPPELLFLFADQSQINKDEMLGDFSNAIKY
jgi:hypothetical protein